MSEKGKYAVFYNLLFSSDIQTYVKQPPVFTVKPVLSLHPRDLPKRPLNRECPLSKSL